MKTLVASVAALIVGLLVGVHLGRYSVYAEAVENDAAVWIDPANASKDSPSKMAILPSIMWRPASRLAPKSTRRIQPAGDDGWSGPLAMR